MTAFCSKPLFMSELRDVLSQPYRVKKEETPAAPYRFEGKKVLLVEDNLLKQEIAQAVLQDAGFTVDTADDGDVAVVRGIDRETRVLQNCLRDLLFEKIVLNQKDLFALKAVRRRGRLLLFHAVGLREHVAQLGHEQRLGAERRHTCLARPLLDVRPVIGRQNSDSLV